MLSTLNCSGGYFRPAVRSSAEKFPGRAVGSAATGRNRQTRVVYRLCRTWSTQRRIYRMLQNTQRSRLSRFSQGRDPNLSPPRKGTLGCGSAERQDVGSFGFDTEADQ